MKLIHITDKPPLYTNCFLLLGANGDAVAIDPAADAERFDTALRENNASLKAILLTHGHGDHVGAVDALKKRHGAKVYICSEDARLFGLQADEFYEDNQQLQWGEIALRVIFTPGHTPGSVCILCGAWLFTGDTLFCEDIGRTDLPGGSHKQIMQSLKKICATVPGNPQVLPGHEEFSTLEHEKKHNSAVVQACAE